MIADLYLERYPFRGARDGLHEWDGQVGDWSQASLDGYCRALSQQGPQGDGHDQELERMTVQNELFWYQELAWHTISPLVYLEAVDPGLYLTRHYAPAALRADRLGQLARQIPGLLEQARKNLTGPASATVLRQGACSAREYVPVYREDAPRAFPQASEASRSAAAALEKWAAWLEERAEKAPVHCPMGEALFTRMLQVGPGIDRTPGELERLADKEIERSFAQAHLIDPDPVPDHPPVGQLLEEARTIVKGLRDFLHQHRVVSLPGEFPCVVRDSPPGARWSFASMDNPGLFDHEPQAFFNITLPDVSWPATEQDDWMAQFDRPMLHLIALHETLPGHFVHALHMTRLKDRNRKLLRNYAFTEGWAHYCEEMMLEVGYGLPDPRRLRSSQLLAALDRGCRLLSSLRLHCAGDDLESVARLFEEKALMQSVRAHASARRGCFDPEYGYYTLGKMAIMKLRGELSLENQDFHDRLLGFGAPPPALLRRSLGLSGSPL